MRPQFLLSLVLVLLLAGCVSDYDRSAGITCTQAIRIAERHSARHPAGGDARNGDSYRYVQRAGWDRADGVWLVDLVGAEGNYGRRYRIDRYGEIIGYRIVDRGSRNDYGPDLTDDGYIGYEGDDGYGHVRSDEALSPVGESPK